MAVGDFNGDEAKDLAVVNAWSWDVSVLLSNGDESFQAARTFGAGSGPLMRKKRANRIRHAHLKRVSRRRVIARRAVIDIKDGAK